MPSPRGGKGRRVAARRLEQVEQRRCRAQIPESLQRVRHRPPGRYGPAAVVECRGSQRLVGTQTDERVKAKAHGLGGQRQEGREVVGADAGKRARPDVHPYHFAHRASIRTIAKHPERFCGTPLHEGTGVLQRREQRGTRGPIADQPEGECRHLADLGLVVCESLRQGLHGLRQAHSPEREHGPSPHAGFVIVEQPDEIGRRWRRDHRRPIPRRRSEDERGRRIRIAQDALILQPHHPSQLVFPRDDGRLRERSRNGRAGGRECGDEDRGHEISEM